MKKFLYSLSLLIVSLNVYANTQNYKIIDEKTTSSPGFHFRVEHRESKAANSAYAHTTVPSVSGKVNQYVQIHSYHDYSINNNTKNKQTYEINYHLECDKSQGDYTRHVDVYPGGYYPGNDYAFGVIQEGNPGSYPIYGFTRISGESGNYSTASGVASITR